MQDGSKVLFIQNNFYYDAFFLKAIGAFLYEPGLRKADESISFQRSMVPVIADGVILLMGLNATM